MNIKIEKSTQIGQTKLIWYDPITLCFNIKHKKFKKISSFLKHYKRNIKYQKCVTKPQTHTLYQSLTNWRQFWKKLEDRTNNPEKYLKYKQTYYKKHSDQIGIDGFDFASALWHWRLTVRKRDKNCQVCGDKNIECHHIFYLSKYPKLSLNENNGIVLCKKHHRELHKLNPMQYKRYNWPQTA